MSEIAVIGDYDVRDKKLADAGTGTSVASTDAVVLKDTNGNYVEIDRDSFTDAIRSALGPILTNMTQKTAASGGVVVNDSNDVGTMNLSNLASVLGVFPMAETIITDADNTFTPGIYAGAIGDRYGVFIVFKAREFYAQLHIYGNNSIAVRRNNTDTGRYNEWHFL